MEYSLLISCEHAGNEIPEKYRHLFVGADAVLESHEGWDPGTLETAQYLGERLSVDPICCYSSRLLIEANRSLNSTQLFSRYTNSLPQEEKEFIIKNYYLPYREKITQQIENLQKPVLHLSMHSFTPVHNGIKRKVDIGLLFDPSRELESQFCAKLKQAMQLQVSYNIKFNEPYLGIDDGLTTHLRSCFDSVEYLGIEIEVNQKFILELDSTNAALLSGLNAVLQIQ